MKKIYIFFYIFIFIGVFSSVVFSQQQYTPNIPDQSSTGDSIFNILHDNYAPSNDDLGNADVEQNQSNQNSSGINLYKEDSSVGGNIQYNKEDYVTVPYQYGNKNEQENNMRTPAEQDELSKENYNNPYESFYTEIENIMTKGDSSGELGNSALIDNINDIEKLDTIMETIAQAASVEPCLKQVNKDLQDDIMSSAVSAVKDAANQFLSGLTSSGATHVGSGSPNYSGMGGKFKLSNLLGGKLNNILGSQAKGEAKEMQFNALMDCITNTAKETKQVMSDMSDFYLEYEYNTKMEAKKKALLNYTEKVTNLQASLEDIFSCAKNKNSYVANSNETSNNCSDAITQSLVTDEKTGKLMYCFVDGLCITEDKKMVKKGSGIDKPSKDEYVVLINNSIKTWIDKAFSSNIDPISSATMVSLLNGLYEKYSKESNTQNDNKSDFITDLQMRINYGVDGAFACIRTGFTFNKSNSDVEEKINIVVNCVNKNIIGNEGSEITLDTIIDNYYTLMRKRTNESKNSLERKLLEDMYMSDGKKAMKVSLYNNYIEPMYYDIHSSGMVYSPSEYALFNNIIYSLFLVHDDFVSNLQIVSANRLANVAHRGAKNYMSIANREALGLKKRAIMDKLERSSIENAVEAQRKAYGIQDFNY